MTSFKLLLLVAVVACYLVQQDEAQACTTTSTTTTCTLGVTFYDHAPSWMTHWRWNPQWYWVAAFYDYPQNGSCGTANNTYGWSNSDFELPLPVLQNMPCCTPAQYNATIIQGERGLVGPVCTSVGFPDPNCGVLNMQTQSPEYAYPGASPLGQVSSPESFATFFSAVEQTFVVQSNLTLTQSSVQPALRTFDMFPFWPLDGLGWNDHGVFKDPHGGPWEEHNFAFCMALHTHFVYQGGEYFTFYGDDDLYVYIGGYLVIDLGGVHIAQNAQIQADSLNLTKGSLYRFDLFYCERHTVSSEIKFETTIGFYCPYTDWCGVCDGNGASCCNGACDDNNLCTIDSCTRHAPPQGCNNTAVVCPPSTSCFISFCDPNTGNCTTTPVNCNDNNNCTKDSCGPAGCSNLPITCPAPNKCQTGGCNNITGCYLQPITCPNSNQCVNVSCDPNIGCISSNIPPPTTNKCQTATCYPNSGWVVTPNPPCPITSKCATPYCNNQTGCSSTPINVTATCGVSTKCIQWYCDPVQGCQYTKPPCVSPDACHTAVCVPATGCQILRNVSCIGDACGSSNCNPTTGACVYTPNAPCPTSPCFNASCNTNTGCQLTPVSCASSQNCTSGTCSNNQCYFNYTLGAPGCNTCGKDLTCDVSNPCNPQVCINGKCVNQPVNCPNPNLCANNTCVAVNGKAQCQSTPVNCSGGNPCNPQSCSPSTGTCVSNPVNCDDGNPCTNNTCVVFGSSYNCTFPAIVCASSSDPFCNPVQCLNGTCVSAPPPDCSDGNPCTYDNCTNGACSNPLVCPYAGTICDPITCINGTCVTQPVNCSSGNLCSIDSCDPATGNCLHIPKNCNGTICSPSSCNLSTGQCEVPQLLNCNDNNPCTLDTLDCNPIDGFSCNNTDESYLCDSNSACILDFCNSSLSTATNVTQACYHQNVTCTAPTICQVVAGCDAKNGCVYAPLICPTPADWCQVAFCDEIAGCLTVARACAPQDNFCYSGVCNNATKTCSQQQRPNWQIITNQQGVTCLLAYNTAAKAGLSAGIIAAIVIAAVVAAALIAVAGKKGVDIFMASRGGPIVPAGNNPLYVEAPNQGTNALYG